MTLMDFNLDRPHDAASEARMADDWTETDRGRRRRRRRHQPDESREDATEERREQRARRRRGAKLAEPRSRARDLDDRADGLETEEADLPERAEPRSLTPEEEAYREARKAANEKIGFLAHLVTFLATCTFLLFVAGFRPAAIVALAWGIGLAAHYFGAVVAPGLRRKMIAREVERHIEPRVSEQKRSLQDEHAHRMEELAAGVAHEIRNPITAAKSLVQQMGEDPGANENIEYADVALAELERVEKSISHLLRYAREEEIALGSVHLADVVDAAIETFRDRIARLGIRIEREVSTRGDMRGDPDQLRRVMVNLIGNAMEAFEEAGTPDPLIHVAAGENLAGSEIWVRVKDNGPGMDGARLQKIFSPFYTSKESGTGLGLALSKKVVDAHGGSMEAQSTPGAGTEFVITFPKQQAEGS